MKTSGSKHSLVWEPIPSMKYYNRNIFIKKFYGKCSLETSSMPFCVYKQLGATFIGK